MANDNKYGRLYPERAVAPLRDLCQRIMHMIVPVSYRRELSDAICQLDLLGFHENEPLFLLRGQDELAPDTVRYYMGIAADRHAPIAKQHDHLYDFALRMERWQPRKLPD